MKITSLSFLLLALPLAVGCAAKNADSLSADDENVTEGSDANETEGNAESLSASLLGGTSGSVGLQSANELSGGIVQLNDTVGAKAEAFFIPSGCLTVTDDVASKTATYAFASCTGPYGLVHVTGTVTITYDVSSGSELHLTYDATNLQINGATIDWHATADVTVSGGSDYDLKWNGTFSGTTASGRAITRTNTKEYKWTAGVACLSVNGSSTGTVTGHELTTDVISYSKCADACPASGSEIKITNDTTGATYDLTYGDDTATYTGPSDKSVSFKPLCAY